MIESIWSEKGDQIILVVDFDIYKFCEKQSLDLSEFYIEGLGKAAAAHTYEKGGFPVVFMKYIDAPYSYVNISIDASCQNVKEWEDYIINKYFNDSDIYFRLSNHKNF